MLYPIYVYAERDCAYSAVFPDIPGCFIAADTIEDIEKAAQEAIETHFGNDTDPIPDASTPITWMHHKDYQEGGFWMLVNIDLNKVRSRAVRLNISLPEGLLHRIDATAQKRGQSRSAFLASAAEREMASA